MRKVFLALIGMVMMVALTIGAAPALADPGAPPIIFKLFCPGQIDVEPQETGGNLIRCFDVPQPTATATITDTPLPPTATSILPTPTLLSAPPTATATATSVPPTTTPTPDCPALSMVHVSGLVNYQITNSGTQTATITRIALSWAGPALLNRIDFGGIPIKAFSPPVSPIVYVTEFEGDISARQLGPGGVKILFLDFDTTPGSVLAITVTVDMDIICTLEVQA